MSKGYVKNLVASALCIAMGLVLPAAFHGIPNAGSIFLPMHIPVLLCGLICGWKYGLIVGILTPFLSSVLTGMPPMAVLPGMICELAVYGFVTGLLIGRVRTGKNVLNLYICLVSAMLCGRLVSGVMNGLIFRAGDYSLQVFATAAFVTGLPGIAIQLVVIPALIIALEKAHLLAAPDLA